MHSTPRLASAGSDAPVPAASARPPRAAARITATLCAAIAAAALPSPARAEERVHDLVIEERSVEIAGRPRDALTLNGSVPGPTLRFTVGDTAVIRVRNLLDEESSVHWHGLLLPNPQDGVPYLTTPPILPGETFTYRFPVVHAGTYWYHSHTGLQEQRGVYGAVVIAPRGGERVPAERDEVVVLSDWTDEAPYDVMRTLMRGSRWYGVRKGTLPNVVDAWSRGRLGAYFGALWDRMPPMDVSDVAYDAFLANGKERHEVAARPGESVRLRFVNASASTNFFLHAAPELGPMTIVAADGPDVAPVAAGPFMIAIAETYDVIVRAPSAGSFEVRATAQDGTGGASVVVAAGPGPFHAAPEIPPPDPYAMDHLLAGAMESLGHPAEATGRPLSPYRALRAADPHPPAAGASVREMELHLTGDMTRYVWSFDGKTMEEEATIHVLRGETLRFVLVNDTMMNHPIHLHGHFFRVLDGDADDAAPLKHTVDVPPMGRRTIEFAADADGGDWFFHCHVLYHMDAGMARVVTYAPPGHRPSLDPAMTGQWWFAGEAMVMSHMTEGHAMVMRGRDEYGVRWDVAWDHDDSHGHGSGTGSGGPPHRHGGGPRRPGAGGHDHGGGAEHEADLMWQRFFDEDLSAFAGLRLSNEHGTDDRGFAGASYRLPLLARATLSADSRGDVRAELSKEFQLTTRLALSLGGRYDTGSGWEGRVGLDYTLTRAWSVTLDAHSEHGFGAGLTFRF